MICDNQIFEIEGAAMDLPHGPLWRRKTSRGPCGAGQGINPARLFGVLSRLPLAMKFGSCARAGGCRKWLFTVLPLSP
jgi:hypothetical protein